MKKTLLASLLTFSSLAAQAIPPVIAEKNNVEVRIADIARALQCELVDRDGNGSKETARLTLDTTKAINTPVGILQKSQIKTDIINDTQNSCGIVEKIHHDSGMLFGAAYARVDSILFQTSHALIEEITVKVSSAGVPTFLPNDDPTDAPVSVELHDSISIPVETDL